MENLKKEKQKEENPKQIKEENNIEKDKTKESEKKEEKDKKRHKEEAIVRGKDLSISTKHAVAICRFIKGKTINDAIKQLEEVINEKRPIPMKGEIPHRRGIERGRYPKKAAKTIIKLLKNLNSNCIVCGIENPYIFMAKADKASRPYRRFGTRRFKRTHITIIAKNKE